MNDRFFASMEQFSEIVVPSSPADREAIRDVLSDISDNKTKIESYQTANTEAIKALAEKYDLPAKFIRKMASAYHKQSFEKEKKEADDFETLYETIIGVPI